MLGLFDLPGVWVIVDFTVFGIIDSTFLVGLSSGGS